IRVTASAAMPNWRAFSASGVCPICKASGAKPFFPSTCTIAGASSCTSGTASGVTLPLRTERTYPGSRNKPWALQSSRSAAVMVSAIARAWASETPWVRNTCKARAWTSASESRTGSLMRLSDGKVWKHISPRTARPRQTGDNATYCALHALAVSAHDHRRHRLQQPACHRGDASVVVLLAHELHADGHAADAHQGHGHCRRKQHRTRIVEDGIARRVWRQRLPRHIARPEGRRPRTGEREHGIGQGCQPGVAQLRRLALQQRGAVVFRAHSLGPSQRVLSALADALRMAVPHAAAAPAVI